ncbi:MAG: hypothetical protein ACXW5U_08110 [Thermoanaerobaculia bacterium]
MHRLAFLAFALALSLSAHAAIFIVDDDGDAGDANTANGVCATATNVCTLRAALQQVNALAGTDTIRFDLAGEELVIQPATPVPVASSMVIDGTTQLGVGAGPFVSSTGRTRPRLASTSRSRGLTVTIDGLAIGGFTEAGIKTWQSGAAVTVKRCHIGVDRDGITPLPNGEGILVRVTSTGGGR